MGKKCCICGEEIVGYGNNPWGAMWRTPEGEVIAPEFAEGETCCDACDGKYVLPGRMYMIYKRK